VIGKKTPSIVPSTRYAPYQLVYGLHLLMLTNILLVVGSSNRQGNLVKVFKRSNVRMRKVVGG